MAHDYSDYLADNADHPICAVCNDEIRDADLEDFGDGDFTHVGTCYRAFAIEVRLAQFIGEGW